MLAFAMISQRRILSLIHLFTAQGATLVAATVVVGYATHQPHLYLSAGITLVLKVILIPCCCIGSSIVSTYAGTSRR
jgi:hydrogenase-4 component E